jgi:hypothetical protein
MMLDAEGMNLRIGVEGENQGGKRIPKSFGAKRDNPTLSEVLAFFESSTSLTKSEKDQLASAAKKVPNGSLANFKANYRKYLKNK